jgi:hypothetical protein
MAFRIFAGIMAIALFLAFLSPVVFKLKEVSLGVVILLGAGLMLWDVWETLREKDE